MIDFTDLPVRNKTYAGANDSKISVIYNGEQYMLKFPTAPSRNREMSYTNGCVSEYIGCHIFESIGIPVQKTLLGTYARNGRQKVVVACKDFQDCSGRIPSRAVDSRIRKYCKHLSITQKSTHKVRMTYISTLIDAGLNINLIRQQVGHEDIFVKTNHINYTSHRILDHNFYARTHSYVNKGMRVITVIIIL